MAKQNLPTMQDVARMAGVTQATVSHVINDSAPVSDEVKEKVNQAVQELGYIPNAVARSLKRRESNTIGLLIPDVNNSYYSELVKAVEGSARENGYVTFLCNTDYKQNLEELYIDHLIQQQAAGIIVGYGLVNGDNYKKLVTTNIPFLCLDADIIVNGQQIPSVRVDNIKGSRLAIEHLCSLNINEIGFISEPLFNNTLRERYTGYRQAMEEAGCLIKEGFISIENEEYDKIEMGYNSISKILNQGRPRAVFVSADQVAFGVIKRLKDLGLKIPEEVAIVGYDDIPLSRIISPYLTTISQPINQMGKKGVHMLLKLIGGKQLKNKSILLEPSLTVRESTPSVQY